VVLEVLLSTGGFKMSDGDPHNQTTRIQNTISSVKSSNKISQENKDLITDFKSYLEGQGLSKSRISRYIYSLKKIAVEVDWNLNEPDKDRLIKLVGDINQSKYWDKEIAEATKKEYKKLIRKFFKDYLSTKNEEIDGEALTDFFTLTVKEQYADPEELPKPHHIARIVRNCKRPRDSSFCMVLWSGARIGAVLGLKWKDIRFHEDIATIKFRETKTGDDRKVPVASAFPYLKQLKENDPLSRNPEAFLFRPFNSQNSEDQLSYNGAKGIVDRAADRADIPERILTNPHAWRKGRISDLARKGFSEAQISKISGHIIGSKEIRVYCRLASEDITDSIREESGLEVEEPEEERRPLKPKKCPNKSCNRLNKWENEHCSNCGKILNTGELFKEVKTRETERELNQQIVEKETSWDSDKVRENAEKLVEEQM
jgi:integrase